MDRLIEAIESKQNPSVVGLDPTPALVPAQVMDAYRLEADEYVEDADDNLAATGAAAAYFEFNRAIIDAVADIVPAVKPQIAMYEALGPAGVDCYTMTCQYAREQGLYVIGDVKRGDIGSTAAAYAKHLTGFDGDDVWHEDALTVNPYLGSDGIEPFVDAAKEADRDLFVLVRTSNPSSAQIQELELADGGRVYEHVADLVEAWGAATVGRFGYGAQGGTAQSVAGMFDRDGSGAIVNSSRGIIGAWRDDARYSADLEPETALDIVAANARRAAEDMRDQLRVALA